MFAEENISDRIDQKPPALLCLEWFLVLIIISLVVIDFAREHEAMRAVFSRSIMSACTMCRTMDACFV